VEGNAEVQHQQAAWPRPAGRPPARHWWSVQPPPPAGAISARRAYAEVLLVFAAFFAASVLVGGEALAGRYPAPSGSWAVFGPAAVSELGTCALAVLVVVLLSARRGITPRSLGLGWPAGRAGTRGTAPSLRIAVWAILALLVGGTVTVALAHGNKLGQPGHQDASYLIYTMAASLTAGVVEEMVVLAFVVTTLRQAARPLPEILLVAVLLRCSYHDYYGLGVLGIAVWAAVFVWLFLRAGSVLPLIVVHVLWDANIFLGQRWNAPRTASAIAFVCLFGAAVISWIADIGARRAPRSLADGPGPRAAGPPRDGPPGYSQPGYGPPGYGPPGNGQPAAGPPAPGPPVEGEPTKQSQ